MTTSFAQKLQIKPGLVLTVINVPDAVKNRLPLDLPDNPLEFGLGDKLHFVLVFVSNRVEVEQIAAPLLTGKNNHPLSGWLTPRELLGLQLISTGIFFGRCSNPSTGARHAWLPWIIPGRVCDSVPWRNDIDAILKLIHCWDYN